MSKAQASVPAPAVALIPSREQIIDNFGELDRQIKQFAPTLKKYEELKVIIKSWYVTHPDEQPAFGDGHLYTLMVSPCEMEATPDKRVIWKTLGAKLAVAICTVTQKAAKQALESLGKSDQFEQCFTQARTGSRKLSVVARQQAA